MFCSFAHKFKVMNKRYLIWNTATLIVVFLVILAGGIVRSTGSGMGCPDWPKCFGKAIPPTHVSELPADYKTIYADFRKAKNERLSKLANALGYSHFAQRLLNDQSIYVENDFNAVKTWIEYINRLLGVVTGLFILLTFVFSLKYIKSNTKVFTYSLFAFITVVVQGILGAFVVSTNLLPFLVTIHLVLALGVVYLLLVARFALASNHDQYSATHKAYKFYALTALLLSLGQIVAGAQVRSSVDIAKQAGTFAIEGFNSMGQVFSIHKFVALFIVVFFVVVYLQARQSKQPKWYVLYFKWLLIFTIAQFVSGSVLAEFNLLSYAQPFHILFASLMFASAAALWILSLQKPMA